MAPLYELSELQSESNFLKSKVVDRLYSSPVKSTGEHLEFFCGAPRFMARVARLQARHTILIWTIQLLGGLAAHGPQSRVRRFRTQKSASLLAYLAFHPVPQPRETLIELLWPDTEAEVGRHNLSMALSFLRHQLEPPGVPPGSVIEADRSTVRLSPAAVVVDVNEFEKALRKADDANLSESERLALLLEASEKYQGTLLPGFYDEWIAPQALRLEGQYVDALARLVALLLATGKQVIALMYAQKAVNVDPLNESATRSLMRALIKTGQGPQALKAYRNLESRLKEELGATPSRELQYLVAQLEKGGLPPQPKVGVSAPQNDHAEPNPQAVPGSLNRVATEFESDGVRMTARNRLIGAEFLLRTTTRFFGRSEEVDRVSRMLSSPRSRLVTLTGSGGTGKTRLAVEVAAQVAESKAGGGASSVFVSLGSVADPDRIFEVILRSLGVTAAANEESLEQLVRVLDARPTLLVLDNFEQLVPSGALRIRDLLASTDSVKLLVTSRQRLLIEGEREYCLSPLPTVAEALMPDELLSVPSIALFVDRAQAVQPDFQLTTRNASAVATLCEVLEGLPLAIELAAARVGSYSPSRILKQVQADRLEFLVCRRRDVISRHKTLRATLDWSYRLLPESAQSFLAGLSVFRGGWTLSAASSVCSLSEEEALEFLALLLDNSLIRVADHEDGMRFTILETIREYSWERLIESGQKEALCRRHRDYFATLADQAEPELTGPSQVTWTNRLQTEHDNLCAAVEWCEKDEASEQKGLRLVGALWSFWEVRGYLSLGRRYLARALELGDTSNATTERAKALQGAGLLALGQGDYQAGQALLQEGLKNYEELLDHRGIAASLDSLGRLAGAQGDDGAALALHEQGLAIQRKLGNKAGIASSLFNLAFVNWARGEPAAAITQHRESLSIRRETGDRRGIADSLDGLGRTAYNRDEYDAAQALVEESLGIRQALGDRGGIARSLHGMGLIADAKGNHGLARTLLEESLKIRRDLGDKDGIANALYGLGNVAHAQGDYDAASCLLRESLDIFRQTGGQFLIHALGLLGHVARDMRDYDLAKENYRESLQLRLERGNAIAVAQSLEDFSGLAWREGHSIRAAKLLGAAEAVCSDVGYAAPAGHEVEYRRTVEVARQELGEDTFEAAWADGREMTLEQGVDYALEVTVR